MAQLHLLNPMGGVRATPLSTPRVATASNHIGLMIDLYFITMWAATTALLLSYFVNIVDEHLIGGYSPPTPTPRAASFPQLTGGRPPSQPDVGATQKCLRYAAEGGIEELDPTARCHTPRRLPGQLLISVAAAGINPVDYKLRSNPVPLGLRPLPFTVGSDVAGTVIEADEDSSYAPLDRVFALAPIVGQSWGTAAEYIAVYESAVARVPRRTTAAEVASLPLVALTVVQAFDQVRPLQPLAKVGVQAAGGSRQGKTALIHAGSGGVGTFAVQYAQWLGYEVTATCSKGCDFLRDELGVRRLIDYSTADVGAGAPVGGYDVILDPIAGQTELRALSDASVISARGHYLSIAGGDGWDAIYGHGSKWSPARVVWQLIRSKVRAWFGAGPAYTLVAVQPDGATLRAVAELVEKRFIRPIVSETFPLAEARVAFQRLERKHPRGKLVLVVDDTQTFDCDGDCEAA